VRDDVLSSRAEFNLEKRHGERRTLMRAMPFVFFVLFVVASSGEGALYISQQIFDILDAA
jgi:hypothetical protein